MKLEMDRAMKQLLVLSAILLVSAISPAEAFKVKIKGVDISIGKKSEPAKQEVHSCTVEAFGNKFFGEAGTEGQAKRQAMESCQQKYHGMHCEEVRCQRG